MSTILIVDDTVLAREAIARLLEYEGFTVLRANDGRAAWTLMYHHSPDLVLLDLVMPEMDGVTLLRMIRGNHRWHDLPVIVVTGAVDDPLLVERVQELEIQALVSKASFNFDDLLHLVKQHLPHAVA